MTTEYYPATSLTGGGAGALDAIPSATLHTTDVAVVTTSTNIYVYYYDGTSAAAESSPKIITPDDIGGGNGRWLLVELYGNLQFPATQNPSGDANTLDDYEEGTWTVTVTPTDSGTITLQAGEQTGAYTKIGRVVHVQGFIDVQAVNAPVGAVKIDLPFTSANLTDTAGYSVGSISLSGVAWAGDTVAIFLVEAQAHFRIAESNQNAASVYVDGADFAADDNISFQLTYIAA